MARAIDADAIVEEFWKPEYRTQTRRDFIAAIQKWPTLTPPNEPLTCEGCAEFGQWENEYEYGYPSPCTFCKRRACDNYRRPPEGEV